MSCLVGKAMDNPSKPKHVVRLICEHLAGVRDLESGSCSKHGSKTVDLDWGCCREAERALRGAPEVDQHTFHGKGQRLRASLAHYPWQRLMRLGTVPVKWQTRVMVAIFKRGECASINRVSHCAASLVYCRVLERRGRTIVEPQIQ